MDRCIKKTYKAIFSDIDGTLLNTSHRIPKEVKQRIAEIKEQGIPFVLVSARMPKGMRGIRDELGLLAPMICYSGALVVDENEESLYSVELPVEAVQGVYQCVCREENDISVNLYREDQWMVEDQTDPWVRQEWEITGVIPQEIPFTDQVFAHVHKILCMGEPEQISRMEEILLDEFPQIRIYKSKPTYLEIMSMEASKSGAIQKLEEKFGIERQEIIAFGDGHNDIDMLQYAGMGIAMGNAQDDVKAAADIVTATNDQGGMYQILKQISLDNHW